MNGYPANAAPGQVTPGLADLHALCDKQAAEIAGNVEVIEAAPAPFDLMGFILAFEQGAVSEEELIDGFQHMIDSGVVWQLQGFYGRQALALIASGDCHD
jgi:hypothetical protein